jgi:hypothetical protein
MRPRWLLLAVSLLCLLVLFPASALSQQQRAELHATCGTARVDGVMSGREWDHAGMAAMWVPPAKEAEATLGELGLEGIGPDVSLAQPATVTVWLYAMHDENYLYLAQLMNLDSVKTDPLYWSGTDVMVFMDEPDALDGDWEAPNCGPPRPGEGTYVIMENYAGALHTMQESFTPFADPNVPCLPSLSPIPGVDWAMAPGSLFVEWEIDLNASDVDKVGPGDCLLTYNIMTGLVCPQGANCVDPQNLLFGTAMWPSAIGAPDVFGMLCLDPCEVEFVPEPGSILLLGSGLAGLAGYAALRLRSGQAFRQRSGQTPPWRTSE